MGSRFLLLSMKGDGLGLALRLKQAGHQVGAWIRGRTEKGNYDGLIEKVERWEDYLTKDTIVVFDSSGGGRSADRLRARGHHVFTGSVFADNLEVDRQLAFELMEQVGIKVPPFKVFYKWEDGKEYVKQRNKRVVFKPSGPLSDDDAVGSYVSSDPDDMMTMMDYFEGVSHHAVEFIIQDFVEGIAVSTEGWFNGYEWMAPFNQTIEHKQMYVDDLGPSSGCAFNIVWKVGQTNKVVEEGIKLMSPILVENNYVGPIDLNTVVNNDGVWALEFTPRFGYDAFPALLELVDMDLGEIIAKMARGEQPDELPLKEGFGSALRVSIPPHPSEEFRHPGGIPIQGLTRSDRPHLYFFEVRFDEADRLVSSCGGGAICAVTGYGKTISESFEDVYCIAKRLRIPEKQYRTDAVSALTKDHTKFHHTMSFEHNILHEVGGNQ
jgi:phosphoribosylamine--glycine ligase